MNEKDLIEKGFTRAPDGSWSKPTRRHLDHPTPTKSEGENDKLVDDQKIKDLWEHYLMSGSVHRTCKRAGVCGETLRKRFIESGYTLNGSKWTKAEESVVSDYYKSTDPEIFRLLDLATTLNRSFAAIACKAEELGVTNKRTDPKQFSKMHRENIASAQRKLTERFNIAGYNPRHNIASYMTDKPNPFKGKSHTEESRKRMSMAVTQWHKANPHPKGMLGKHHSKETKEALSIAHSGRVIPRDQIIRRMKTVSEKYGPAGILPPNAKVSWRQGWRTIGEVRIYARSRWEANYGRYLEFLKTNKEIQQWEHEPETFWFEKVKRGAVSYLPDFRVTLPSGLIEYHEVKGWMDKRSKTKINRMARYYPNIKLVVRDAQWFRKNQRQLSGLIKDWETRSSP